MKALARLFAFILITVIVLALVGTGIIAYLNQPGDRILHNEREFTIHPGESLTSVERRLFTERIIRHELIFRVISLISRENIIKSGTYRIDAGLSAREIFRLFVSGKQILKKITIPEGWTLSKIARALQEKGICDSDAFISIVSERKFLDQYGIIGKNAEGYLFPDTYMLPPEYPPEKVAKYMVDTFFRRIGDVYPDYGKLSSKQLHDKVTLASIIEREYRINSDAPLMASVFYNRLKMVMHLGSCATVEYIISEIQGRNHPEYLTNRDLEIDSEYNTYIRYGLPPGPISNPGETALKAAFYPADSNYLYFVLQNVETGKHYFSKSLDEHNDARRFYLKKY